jgi:uncharacterized membrane protein YphA (DoxX/SURF4 family)
MFPTGSAGAALLVLRISVGATLVADGTAHWPTALSIIVGLCLPAACLCIGLFTPYAAALSCIIQVGDLAVFRGDDWFHFVIFILESGVLAVLGPGAYSVDALIFGRRRLIVPPRRH